MNLLAVWRAHGLDAILHEAWQAGVVLAGGSAGALCWHSGGTTASFGPGISPVADGLGFLPSRSPCTTTPTRIGGIVHEAAVAAGTLAVRVCARRRRRPGLRGNVDSST